MKKTRFFLTALLLMTVLVFTACGSRDDNNDAVPDDQQNGVEQNIDDDAEDLKDDIEDIGDDVKDGAEDIADDADDAVTDPDGGKAAGSVSDSTDVNRNTADNGTMSNVQ